MTNRTAMWREGLKLLEQVPPRCAISDSVANDDPPDIDVLTERYYTITEIARLLNAPRETVRRSFSQEPGVIRIGKVVRVPESVLHRVVLRNSTGLN